MEQRAGDRERERSAGFQSEREREGVRGVTGTEHLAVESESLGEEALLCKLSEASVPWNGARGCGGARGFDGSESQQSAAFSKTHT